MQTNLNFLIILGEYIDSYTMKKIYSIYFLYIYNEKNI